MKRVLITGANSYIGTNVEKWLMKEPENFYIETLDMKKSDWKSFDFTRFDVVFHVAGIAHVSQKRRMKDLYLSINRDLTTNTAQKAKDSGVRHFIFMSSMIVYNSNERKIVHDTEPNPNNFYGLSKLEAEINLNKLIDKNFNVTILRPPMIYGKGSKGNFPKLIKLSKNLPIFPKYSNKRSMLYIDNLCESVKKIIIMELFGLVFPQNREYSCTSDIIGYLSRRFHKRIWFTRLFNPIIKILILINPIFNKLFSDSYYDMKMSSNIIDCSLTSLYESLEIIGQQ